MEPLDRVTVPLMPHLGVGLVDWIVPSPFDRVVVSFEIEGRTYREDFAVSELELVPKPVKA